LFYDLKTTATYTKRALPRRALELVMDWAELHQLALIEDWNLCKSK
jgi:hypothetical protein